MSKRSSAMTKKSAFSYSTKMKSSRSNTPKNGGRFPSPLIESSSSSMFRITRCYLCVCVVAPTSGRLHHRLRNMAETAIRHSSFIERSERSSANTTRPSGSRSRRDRCRPFAAASTIFAMKKCSGHGIRTRTTRPPTPSLTDDDRRRPQRLFGEAVRSRIKGFPAARGLRSSTATRRDADSRTRKERR